MRSQAEGHKFDVFITHNWAKDELGRDNHDRAKRIAAQLTALGLRVWFDADMMQAGHIDGQMSAGIDDSATVLVLVTQTYILKASGRGENGDDDNCKFEFDYALAHRGVGKMLTAVMEPSCLNARAWIGSVGGRLGSRLYVDLSMDDESFDAGIDRLADQIRALAGATPSPERTRALGPAGTAARAPPPYAAAERAGSLSTAGVTVVVEPVADVETKPPPAVQPPFRPHPLGVLCCAAGCFFFFPFNLCCLLIPANNNTDDAVDSAQKSGGAAANSVSGKA